MIDLDDQKLFSDTESSAEEDYEDYGDCNKEGSDDDCMIVDPDLKRG